MTTDRNVLGGELEPCGTDPMTGFFRDGCFSTGPEDLGSHTICAVVTSEFLEHQRSIGNDLSPAHKSSRGLPIRGRDAINAAIRFILAMSLAAVAGSARAM